MQVFVVTLSHLCPGEEVPLRVENDLLSLVAYHGLDNSYSTTEDDSDIYIHWGGSKPPAAHWSGSKPPDKSSSGARTDEENRSGEVGENESDNQLDLDGTSKGTVSVWR